MPSIVCVICDLEARRGRGTAKAFEAKGPQTPAAEKS